MRGARQVSSSAFTPDPQLFNHKQEMTPAACASLPVVGSSRLRGRTTAAQGYAEMEKTA